MKRSRTIRNMDELCYDSVVEDVSEDLHVQEQSYEEEDEQIGLYLDDDDEEVCPPCKHRKHDDSDFEFLVASRTTSFFTAKEDDDDEEVNDDSHESVFLEDENPTELRPYESDFVFSSCATENFGIDTYNSGSARRKSGVEDITAHLMNLFAGQSSFVL